MNTRHSKQDAHSIQILKSLQNIEKLEKSISMISSITLKQCKSKTKIYQIQSPSKIKPIINDLRKKSFVKYTSPLNNKIIKKVLKDKCILHPRYGCQACNIHKQCTCKKEKKIIPKSPNKNFKKERSFCVISVDENKTVQDKQSNKNVEQFKNVLHSKLQQINTSLLRSRSKLQSIKNLGSLKNLVKANFQTLKKQSPKIDGNMALRQKFQTTKCFTESSIIDKSPSFSKKYKY